MPEERDVWREPESEQPNNPENPPQVLLRPEVRRAALMSYLGPVIALFVIIGLALIYWANRGPVEPDPNDRVADAIGTIGGRSAGGSDPAPDFDRTRDELAYRGGDTTPLTSVSDVIAAKRSGRIVQLNGAEVVSIDANVLQIRDGDATAMLQERAHLVAIDQRAWRRRAQTARKGQVEIALGSRAVLGAHRLAQRQLGGI